MYEHIKGFGYFADEIVAGDILKGGEFYVVAPEDADIKKLYDFNYGGRIFPRGDIETVNGHEVEKVENYGEPTVKSMIKGFLLKGENNYVLFEDYLSKSTDKWIEVEKPNYYTINNEILYLLTTPNIDEVDRYYNLANNFHFMPIMFQYELPKMGPKSDIGLYSKAIVNNIQVLFYEIYDGESFLIWVKSEETNFITSIVNTI